MNRIPFHTAVLGLLLNMYAKDSFAQNREYNCLSLAVDSEVSIEGAANIGTFKCFTQPLRKEKPISSCFLKTEERIEISQVEFEIPIDGIGCGNPLVVKDLRDVLDSQSHPNIVFDLHELVAYDVNGKFYRGKVTASTEVKGVRHDISLPVEVDEFSPNHFKVSGQTPILLSWYGIDAPSKFFGLLTLEDRIDVCFELSFKKR